jgi:Exopolysaccharide biosynthesis protein YbjH
LVTRVLLLGLVLTVAPLSGQIPNALSTHGLPGLVNTPSATILPDGWIEFNLNNMIDVQRLSAEQRSNLAWQGNFQFAFSLFGRLTLGGRGTEMRTVKPLRSFFNLGPDGSFTVVPVDFYARDLAGNVSLLLLKESAKLPSVSLGTQDLAGASVVFRGRYLVATKTLAQKVRISAGYGIGPSVLDGFFGGVEIAAIPNRLSLLGEYDAVRFNGALRVRPFPRSWVDRGLPDLSLDVILSEGEGIQVGGSLRLPLDRGIVEVAPESKETLKAAAGLPKAEFGEQVVAQLVKLGLEEVAARYRNDGLLEIHYENRVFNQSQLDGIAEVLRAARAMARDGTVGVRLYLSSGGAGVLTVEASLDDIDRMASGEQPIGLKSGFAPPDRTPPRAIGSAEGRVDIALRPVLEYVLFTESGVMEGRFNAEPQATMRLFGSTALDVGVRIPIDQSPRFFITNGPVPSPSVSRLAIRHFRRVSSGPRSAAWAEWSAGRLFQDFWGLRQQFEIMLDGGRWSVGADLAGLRHSFDGSKRMLALAQLTSRIPEADVTLDLSGGRFLFQDWGVAAEVTTHFGDTGVTFIYRHTNKAAQAGLGFSVPLSFRKDLKPRPIRPRMVSDWYQAAATTIFQDRNSILKTVGSGLPREYSMNSLYFDRSRLSPAWIRARITDSRHWRP